jgi:hypothetical protein
LPFALAFRRPAFTRSTISERYNSATAPRTVKTSFPAGVLVSSCSENETNSMPCALTVPIERVSVLLGHQSVRVTERHYNPWVRSRQEQVEADVASAWKLDPVLDSKIIRTNSVHIEKGPVN